MSELRLLNDNEMVKGDHAKIFNFMFKKNKVKRIKFELNSKDIWIFPLSKEEKNFHYQFTDPNPKFLDYVDENRVHEIITQIN